MNAFGIRDEWPIWRKILVIAALVVPVMLWVLLTDGQYFPLVLAYGLGICALGGYWLGGRWWLVPPLAMGVELVFAIPATVADPTDGETPVSVVLEAPFWTGAPALVGATLGATTRWFQGREAAARGARQSQRHG